MATHEQPQPELVQRTEALKTEAEAIEARKAEVETLEATIQQRQQTFSERYAPAIQEGEFVGSNPEELRKVQETEKIIERMGGDVSQYEAIRKAVQAKRGQEYGTYQTEATILQELINEYNRKRGVLSSDIEAYNLKSEQLSKDVETYNRQAEMDFWLGGVVSFHANPERGYDPSKFPTLAAKALAGDRYIGQPAWIEYQSPSGSINRAYVGSEEDVINVMKTYSAIGQPIQTEAYAKDQARIANLQSGFQGILSDEAIQQIFAPIGTVFDVERAAQAGAITKDEATKIKYLQSGTAQFLSSDELERLSSSVPYALGEGGLILSSTPKQRELESRFYEKTGQTFLNTDYSTVFKNIGVKDYGVISDLVGLSRPQLHEIKRSVERESWDMPVDINLETGERWSEPDFAFIESTKLAEAEQMKSEYAMKWWTGKSITEKAFLGFGAITQSPFTNLADTFGATDVDYTKGLQLESVQFGEEKREIYYTKEPQSKGFKDFPLLAYKTTKEQQEYYQKYGYEGGFGASVLGNTGVMLVGSAITFGAGLGLVSKIPKVGAPIATGIGATAVTVGVADVSLKTAVGDYRSAMISGTELAASTPFAVAGFKGVGGRTMLLPSPKGGYNRAMFGDTGQWIKSKLPAEPRGEFDIGKAMFGDRPLTFREPSYSLPGLLVIPKPRPKIKSKTVLLTKEPQEIIYGAKSDIILPQDIIMKPLSKADLEVPTKTKIESMFDTKEIFNAQIARQKKIALMQKLKANVLSQAQKAKRKKDYAQLLQKQWAAKITLTPPEEFTITGLRAKEAQRESEMLAHAEQVYKTYLSQSTRPLVAFPVVQKQKTKQLQKEIAKSLLVFKPITPQKTKQKAPTISVTKQAAKLISPQISKQITKQKSMQVQVLKMALKPKTRQITPEKVIEQLISPQITKVPIRTAKTVQSKKIPRPLLRTPTTPQLRNPPERRRTPKPPRTPKTPPIKPPKFGLGGNDLMNQLVGKGKKSKAWKVENPFIRLKNL